MRLASSPKLGSASLPLRDYDLWHAFVAGRFAAVLLFLCYSFVSVSFSRARNRKSVFFSFSHETTISIVYPKGDNYDGGGAVYTTGYNDLNDGNDHHRPRRVRGVRRYKSEQHHRHHDNGGHYGEDHLDSSNHSAATAESYGSYDSAHAQQQQLSELY